MNKKQTIILLALLTLIPVTILTLFLFSKIKETTLENSVEQYSELEESIGKQTASVLENQFGSFQDKLYAISQIPEIRYGDTEVCNAKLTEVLAGLQVPMNNIGRIGEDGKFKCSVNKALVGVPGSNLGPYITEIFEDPEHKPVMSRKIKVPNVEGLVQAIHIPVFDDENNFIGTLGGALYIDEIRDNYLSNISLAKNGFISLFDDNGDILSHPNQNLYDKNLSSPEYQSLFANNKEFNQKMALAQKGEQQTMKYVYEGEERIAVLLPIKAIPGRYWVINVTVPVKDIRETINSTEVENIFNVALGIMLGFIIITPITILFYLIFKVFYPIDNVMRSMKRVSLGDFDEQIKYNSGSKKDEIFQLVDSFNIMIKKLKESYTILEEKVSERTSDLQQAKGGLEEEVALRTKELEEAKKDLEQKVEDRTKDLQQKIEELEKINRVAVDRELRMIELKKELDELKGARS